MSPTPVIVSAKRTPIGRFMGSLTKVPAPKLGAFAIGAALDAAPGYKDHDEECIMGCVLQGGLGQNPARQAGLAAGLPTTLNAQTVNKVCGSGLQSVMLAAQSIKAGDNEVVVAGGFENMSAAPHFAHVRGGVKYGPTAMQDLMAHDGLTCAFEACAMGNSADYIAGKYSVSREEQDRFAAQSHQRAAKAWDSGWFDEETVALTGEQVGNRKAPGPEGGIARDEGIRGDSTAEGLAKLRPAFKKDVTVTAGNASQISDGAAATVVMSETKASAIGTRPIAKILAYHTHGVDPKDIFAAPIGGISGVLDRAGLKASDIDLFEVNEAFAAQACAVNKDMGWDPAIVNVNGGAIAIGHPIGASGARILNTLLHEMVRRDAKKGLATLCIGGGMGVAMCLERD